MTRLRLGTSGHDRQHDEKLEIDMLKRPLVIAIIATTLTSAALATKASANGDPALGALLGAGIGAAIGNSVNHHNGAWVGGAIGALAGASIAANAGGYYGPGYGYAPDYYGAPAPAYYSGPTTYYAPAPAYYAAPAVVFRSRPVYVGAPYRSYARPYAVQYRAPGRPDYGHGRGNWQDGGQHGTTGLGQWQPRSPR
jgi:hypothetical protein